ncbi:MAG: type III-B CRISPR module RAMP protein Cmr6 [Bacteroidota bacterium]
MNTPNLGWLYYKEYYYDFDFKRTGANADAYQERFFRNKHSRIRSQKLDRQSLQWLKLPVEDMLSQQDIHGLQLQTIYPGFASGLGLIHETGSMGESKLGMAFDHVTGIPYLPGSSVKGALRAVFPQQVLSTKQPELDVDSIADRRRFIYALLESVLEKSTNDLSQARDEHLTARAISEEVQLELEDDFVDLLERELFDGTQVEMSTEEGSPGLIHKARSTYHRDLFLDAFPMESLAHEGRFLDFDFITPHKRPFANPVPIMFLKILPEVLWQFSFKLEDGLLTGQQKLKLFEHILTYSGAGAKTHVGYGQFKTPEPPRVFMEGEELQGKISISRDQYASNRFTVYVEDANWEKTLQVKENLFRQLTDGNTYTFRVSKLNEDGSIRSVKLVPPSNQPNRSGRKRR